MKGLLRPDHAREALRSSCARQESELHLGKPKARRLDPDPVVTGEGNLETPAERGAMNRRHHGLGPSFEEDQDLMQTGRLRGLAELGDVGAGDERPPGADDHDGPYSWVGVIGLDPVAQPQTHPVAQRVDRRIVDGKHGDAASTIEVDERCDGGHNLPLPGDARVVGMLSRADSRGPGPPG